METLSSQSTQPETLRGLTRKQRLAHFRDEHGPRIEAAINELVAAGITDFPAFASALSDIGVSFGHKHGRVGATHHGYTRFWLSIEELPRSEILLPAIDRLGLCLDLPSSRGSGLLPNDAVIFSSVAQWASHDYGLLPGLTTSLHTLRALVEEEGEQVLTDVIDDVLAADDDASAATPPRVFDPSASFAAALAQRCPRFRIQASAVLSHDVVEPVTVAEEGNRDAIPAAPAQDANPKLEDTLTPSGATKHQYDITDETPGHVLGDAVAKIDPCPKLTQEDQDFLASRCDVVARGLSATIASAKALSQIFSYKGGVLWKATHSSFKKFCRDRFELERSHAYRLRDAGDLVIEFERLFPRGDQVPVNEKQLRPLFRLPQEQRLVVLSELVAETPAAKLTNKMVSARVESELAKLPPSAMSEKNPPAPRPEPVVISEVITRNPAEIALETASRFRGELVAAKIPDGWLVCIGGIEAVLKRQIDASAIKVEA